MIVKDIQINIIFCDVKDGYCTNEKSSSVIVKKFDEETVKALNKLIQEKLEEEKINEE